MKTITVANQAMLDRGMNTLEWSVKFTRRDGVVFRYTSGASDATLGGFVHSAQPGFKVSNITCTLGYGVDTLEMTVLTTDDMVRADFLTGRWDRCRVEFNQYDWTAPADGTIAWPVYAVANVQPIQGGFTIEMRDLRQPMQQDYTRATGKTCPYRLGDARCGVVLAGSPVTFTHAFTVTGVTSRSIFTCSGLAQATDYFSNGECTFAVGLHADLPLLVRSHSTGGVITLAVPLIDDILIGDTGTVVAGCLKRFTEDCKTKFDNVLNFGGQKDAPTTEELVGQ
jgi:uncharacterized phage protein (TIGR02218 family)